MIASLSCSDTGPAPLVSVVLPVNEDPHGYLDSAVNSLCGQSFTDFELIIVANGSDDAFIERLSAYDDPRIRLVRIQIGQSPLAANIGLECARGLFVARMDADDICEVDRLAVQVDFLRANPDIDVLGTAYRMIDETGAVLSTVGDLALDHRAIASQLPLRASLAHPTVMVRRASVIAVSGYAYGPCAEDWDLWLRMLRAGKRFANLAQPLVRYRLHDEQATGLKRNRRNIGYVVGLLLREAIITGRPLFVVGAIRFAFLSGARGIYRRIVGPKRRRNK